MKRIKIFTQRSARATLTIDTETKTAKIGNLFANVPREGHGTLVMNDILAFADENGLSLWLEARQYGKPQNRLTTKDLIEFYKKFGFVVTSDKKVFLMTRSHDLHSL